MADPVFEDYFSSYVEPGEPIAAGMQDYFTGYIEPGEATAAPTEDSAFYKSITPEMRYGGLSLGQEAQVGVAGSLTNIDIAFRQLGTMWDEVTGDYYEADQGIAAIAEIDRVNDIMPHRSITDIRDIESGEDFMHWLVGVAPEGATYITTGGVGALVTKIGARFLVKGALKGIAKKKLRDSKLYTNSQIDELLTDKGLIKATTEQFRARVDNIASMVGYGAGFAGLETGLIGKEIYDETGELRPGLATAYGVVSGSLSMPAGAWFGKLIKNAGLGKLAKTAGGEATIRKGAQDILKKAGIGGAIEAPIEMIQEVLNIYAVKHAKDDLGSALTKEDKWRIANAGAAAFAAGASISGAIETLGVGNRQAQKAGEKLQTRQNERKEEQAWQKFEQHIRQSIEGTIIPDRAAPDSDIDGFVNPEGTVQPDVNGQDAAFGEAGSETEGRTHAAAAGMENIYNDGTPEGELAGRLALAWDASESTGETQGPPRPETGGNPEIEINQYSPEDQAEIKAANITLAEATKTRTAEHEAHQDELANARTDVEKSAIFDRDDKSKAKLAEAQGRVDEAYGKARAKQEAAQQGTGQAYEFNVATQGENNTTQVVDEEGKTHELSPEQASTYKQLTRMVPKFARGILKTAAAIRLAPSIVANQNGTQSALKSAITATAKHIVAELEEIRDSIRALTREEAEDFRDANEWLDAESTAEDTYSMADTIPGVETEADASTSEAFGEGITVLENENEIGGQQPKIIGRNRLSESDSAHRPDVREWDKPFTSGEKGRNGKNQAEHQLNRITKPGSPDYNNPADVQMRAAYNPDTHEFEVRAVDKDGNILPKRTPWKKAAGHVVVATPVDAREGLGQSTFGTGLTNKVMARLHAALDDGHKYAHEPKKYPNAAPMTISFKGVQTIRTNKKDGNPFQTEASAKTAAKKLADKNKETLYTAVPIEGGWAVEHRINVQRDVYLPSLLWAGKEMLQASGLLDADFSIVVEPADAPGNKGNSGALRSLTEGMQGLDEFLKLQGIEANVIQQLSHTIQKEGTDKPILKLNGQTLSWHDIRTAAARSGNDVKIKIIEATEGFLEEERRVKENPDEVTPEEIQDVEDQSLDLLTFFNSVVLPRIRGLVPGRVKSKSGKGSRMGTLSPELAANIARAILNTAITVARDPQISLLNGEPNPRLTQNLDPIVDKDGNVQANPLVRGYNTYNAGVYKMLLDRVPALVRKNLLSEDGTIDEHWADSVSEMTDMELLAHAVTIEEDIHEVVNEVLEGLIGKILKDIVNRKKVFVDGKLVDGGGMAEQLSWADRPEREWPESNIPRGLNAEIAKIEGIAAGIRAFYIEVADQTMTEPVVQFQLKQAQIAKSKNEHANHNQTLEEGYDPAPETDPTPPPLEGGRDPTAPIDDVVILQNHMDANDNSSARTDGARTDPTRDRATAANLNINNSNPEARRIFDTVVLGEAERYREQDGTGTPFNLPKEGVRRFNDDNSVIVAGRDNFVASKMLDTMFELTNWAVKTFGLTDPVTRVDTDTGQEFVSRRTTLILDSQGFETLMRDNPAFAKDIGAAMTLNETAAFKVFVPSEVGSDVPFIIVVNEDYKYLDAKSQPFTINDAKEANAADVITAFSHELGHIVFDRWRKTMPTALKQKLNEEYLSKVPKKKRASYTIHEWMADQFAIYVETEAQAATTKGTRKTGKPAEAKRDSKQTWSRKVGSGYEVSSKGDKRFSALNARLPDGRTIETAWANAKGYPDWRAAKGKPALTENFDYWGVYKGLWRQWANANPALMKELAAKKGDRPLVDRFANTDNNQARALAEIINETNQKGKPATGKDQKASKDRIPPAWKKLFNQLNKLYQTAGHFIQKLNARAKGPSETYRAFLNKVARSYTLKEHARALFNQQSIEAAQAVARERDEKVAQTKVDETNAQYLERKALEEREEADRIRNGETPSRKGGVGLEVISPFETLVMAANHARQKLEEAYAEEGIIDPALRLRDPQVLRTVNPDQANAESQQRNAEQSEKASRKKDTPEAAVAILRAAAGPRTDSAGGGQGGDNGPRRRPFFDGPERGPQWEDTINAAFSDSPRAREFAKNAVKLERRVWSSIGTRLNELPGGSRFLKALRERPGDATTGKGTAKIAHRHYMGVLTAMLPMVRKRDKESKANYEARMAQLQADVATGDPQTVDGKAFKDGVKRIAKWGIAKQLAAREKALNKDSNTAAPAVDDTVLRILEDWVMPHNYHLFNMSSPEGKARFFELLDKYEKEPFKAEHALTTDTEWNSFREYMHAKIVNSEGTLTGNMADNLRFANSRSRVLKRIPTWELLGSEQNGVVPLIDNQIDKAMRSYIHDLSRQISWEEEFGGYEQDRVTGMWRWNSNKDIHVWIDDLKARDRRDGTEIAAEAEEVMDVLQGRSNRKLTKKWRVASDIALAMTNMLILPFAVFASLPDLAGIGMRADADMGENFFHNVKAAASAAWGRDVDGLNKLASELGIVQEHVIQHAFLDEGDAAFDNFWGGKHQKVMEWQENFFKVIQLQAYTNFTRILAMQVGRDFMNHNTAVMKVAQQNGWSPETHDPTNPVHQRAKIIHDQLGELIGPEQDPVALWEEINRAQGTTGGRADYLKEQEAQIMNKFVDEAIMRPDAIMKPGWQSDPRWRTVTHLKSFMWYMQETYWPRMFKKFENAIGPDSNPQQVRVLGQYMMMAMMMAPLSLLGLALRDIGYYIGTDDEPPERDIIDYVARTGGFGSYTLPLEFIDDSMDWGFTGNTVARALGPIPGIAYNAATQGPRTTLSKSIPGISYVKAGRNWIAGRPNDKSSSSDKVALGRIGN